MNLSFEVKKAINEQRICENHFNNAAPEFVEIAIHQLIAAEKKVNTLIKLRNKKIVDPLLESPQETLVLPKPFINIVPQEKVTVKRKIVIDVQMPKDVKGKQIITIVRNFRVGESQ